jgi:hypothetical protein
MILQEACRRSFPTFASKTQILSETAAGPAADWLPFKLWDSQQAVAEAFEAHRLVVVLKARQLGLSWLGIAFALWHLVLHPVSTCLLFSKRDDESMDLLARLREMSRRLPDWLKPPPPVVDNGHELSFPDGSRALAFPTTAGDSYTATLAIVDEADLVPNLDALLRATKPTVDAAGRLLLIGRADQSRPESPFKRIYRAAKEGKSDWHPIFLSWRDRPDRSEEWYAAQKKDIEARTGSLDALHEQYPQSDLEALSPRSLDKRLPGGWLAACFEPAVPIQLGRAAPLDVARRAPPIPQLVVYALPEPGRAYVVGADPAEGSPTSDDSALVVLDSDTGEEVASLAGKLEPGVFAAHIHAIALWYNRAHVMIERNNHGHAVILWLRDNSPLLLLSGHDSKAGWHTTTKGKALLYDTAAEAFRDSATTLHSEATYHQLASIEGATLRAPEGQRDDRAVSFALALQGRAHVQRWSNHGREPEPPCVLTAGYANPFGEYFGPPAGHEKLGATGFGAEGDIGRGPWIDATPPDWLDPFQGWRPG